jgi:DNA-binding protein YbaB
MRKRGTAMFNESMSQQLDGLRKAFQESQQQMASAQEKAKEISIRVEAPDRSMVLTLDSGGGIKELEFCDESYQELEPGELSEKIVALFSETRARLHGVVLESMPSMPFAGTEFEQMLNPSGDAPAFSPEDLLSSLFGQPERDSRGDQS